MADETRTGAHLRKIQRLQERTGTLEGDNPVTPGVIEIAEKSHFGEFIAGVATLTPGFVFMILQPIELGNCVLEGVGVTLLGTNSPKSRISTNSPFALFTSIGDGFLTLHGVELLNTGGPLLKIDLSSTSDVIISSCSSPGGPKIGTITGARAVTFERCVFDEFDDGLTFDGATSDVKILGGRIGATTAGSGFCAVRVTSGASIVDGVIDLVSFKTRDASDECVALDVNASYVGPFNLSRCTLGGAGQLIAPAGLQKTDPKLITIANPPIEDSLHTAAAQFDENSVATVTSGTPGVQVHIGAGAPGHKLFDGGSLTERFVLSGAGIAEQVFTYIGLERHTFGVRVDGAMTRQGGGANVLAVVAVRKNDITILDSIEVLEIDANRRTSFFSTTTTEMKLGDELSIVIANVTNTVNLTVISCKWSIDRKV